MKKKANYVGHLGSGIPCILQYYGKDSFRFTENFIKITFYADVEGVEYLQKQENEQEPPKNPPSTPQVEGLIKNIDKELSLKELLNKMNLKDRKYFRTAYLQKAIEEGFIELTIPDKPNSSKQKYSLTEKGKQLQKQLKNMEQNDERI
jgi:predicted transcriptional regulator